VTKSQKKGRTISALVILLVSGCIDPLVIKLSNSHQSLVVDGMITDEHGPYEVKLTRTVTVEDQLNTIPTVSNAVITIFDDLGNEEQLVLTKPGVYETKNFQGVVGRTYHIKIVVDGVTYESLPETMLPAGELNNVYAEFSNTLPNAAHDSTVSSNGFNIYLDVSLDPAQNGLARWRWTGTYEVLTYPSLRRVVDPNDKPPSIPPKTIPAPRRCSGWIVDLSDNTHQTIIQTDTCSCCKCWITENNTTPLISDKRFTEGGHLTKVNVAFIQATRRHFFERYYLEVEQLSTSSAVHDFWDKISKQKQNGSDLFQTPPARTIGNIFAKVDDAPTPIGVFAVAAVKRRSLVLYRHDVPYPLIPIDTITDSCLMQFKISTNKPPSFW
jgi:Domain of unknown function (DUF4249)